MAGCRSDSPGTTAKSSAGDSPTFRRRPRPSRACIPHWFAECSRVQHRFVEKRLRLLMPDSQPDCVGRIHQALHVGNLKSPAEVPRRGRIRNPLRSQRIQVHFIVAPQFDVFQTRPSVQCVGRRCSARDPIRDTAGAASAHARPCRWLRSARSAAPPNASLPPTDVPRVRSPICTDVVAENIGAA